MMKLSDRICASSRLKWAAAIGLNAVFLLCALLLFAPGFESANDDLTLAAFVDGQMSEACTHIPYINYLLALLLRALFSLPGDSIPWHTLGQYALLLLGFSAVSRALLEKLRPWQAGLLSLIMLLFFGLDCYMLISYTKTAAVCTVGGMCLLFMAAELPPRGARVTALILGTLLCLFGFLLRKMEFLPCMAITAVLGARWLYQLLFLEKGPTREKLRALLRYVSPFLLMLALCAAAWGVDELAWSRGEWKAYHDFDAVRVAYSDYGRPAYEEMSEVYDSLGLTESAVELLEQSNYFDPDTFTSSVMAAITDARDSAFPRPSPGECLGRLLDTCIPAFFTQLPVYALVALLILWLCAGEHDLRGWLTLALSCGLFALFYLYLIWRGRYLIDRVDLGLFLAVFAVVGWTLRPEKLSGEKPLAALVLLLALFFGRWAAQERGLTPPRDYAAERAEERAAVERILADNEHVYLAKLDVVSDTLYSPFERVPAGYWDKIVLLGGWDCNHPAVMANLRAYNIANPYRDLVDNDRAYIIDDDIDLTLRYLRDYYFPDADAELVEPLSSETGLAIYRIFTEANHDAE